MNNVRIILLTTACCFLLSACNNDNNGSQHKLNANTFFLNSSEMLDDGQLPIIYTCDGEGITPPLNWGGEPEGTKAYALIMHHNAPEGVHWYWTLYNIPAQTTEIKSNEIIGSMGANSINNLNEYAPPCSKGGGKKEYIYTVYALSAPIVVDKEATDRATLIQAIKKNTIDFAQMKVSYARSGQERNRPRKKPKPKSQLINMNSIVEVDSARCETVKKSINDAGFNKSVSVKCDENYAYIASDTYPDHELMTGITGTNEQIPVPAPGYAAPIKLTPKKADKLTTIDAAIGVAVNGVPIYDYSSQGELDLNKYDEKHDTLVLGQLDNCGGHSGRGDDYHYHVSPTCMIGAMKNKGNEAIIGWAYDGYPLYGNKNPDGSDIVNGELDLCNGQADKTFGYRYQTSTTPPYIIQCLVGEVDTAILPRVSPLNGDTEKMRADLKPPTGGVKNLTHIASKDGTRTMSYTYQGEEYFTTYKPSTKGENCYDFTQKTISNDGKLETGTFCRSEKNSDNKPQRAVEPQGTVKNKIETAVKGDHHFKLEAWADNWFAAYIGEDLLIEDSVSITTERSFNAESLNFSADYPIQLNLVLKDFKQNDTGLEYIGARNQQMGDGGFILQLTDTDTNKVIAVSNSSWKCEVLHQAPLNKSCENESNPQAGVGACSFISNEAPADWLKASFDDAKWDNATEHSEASVGPKDGYDDINWDANAKLIWGADLETDNTLICRTTIESAL